MKRIVLLLLAALLLSTGAGAELDSELAEIVGMDELKAVAALPEGENTGMALLRRLKGEDLLRPAFSAAALLLTVMTVCGSLDALFSLTEKRLNALELAGTAVILLSTVGGERELLSLCRESLVKLQDISNVLLPTMSSAAAACGKVGSAAVRYAAAALSMNLLINAVERLILPLLYLFLAASAAEAACGNAVLSAAIGFLRWLMRTLLTVITLVFSLYISLTSLGGGAADAAMVKTAKTALSAAVPVVGGIAADAAAALLSSAELIRKTAGVTGLLAVAAALLLPFAKLGVNYILYKSMAVLGEGLFPSRLATLSGRISESLSLLMGCLGACGIMLYFAVFSMMGVMNS